MNHRLPLEDGEWVVLRMPYPPGFYTKWIQVGRGQRGGRTVVGPD